MALTRYEPRNAMRSAFSPLLAGDWSGARGLGDVNWPLAEWQERAFPAVEIREDDSAYYVAVELPGYAPEQVEVTAEGDTLTISGHRELQSEDASVRYSERVTGKFVRTLTLPQMDATEVSEARMENGLLKVQLHKAKEGQRQRIQVQAS